jgi:hypothetical protein
VDDRIAVGRKAARYQRRRRTVAVAVVALALVVTAATASVVSRRGSGGFPGRESGFDFNRAAVVAVDSPVPTTALEDVVFVDAGHGFGLADHRNHLVLARTIDGGQDWRLVSNDLPLSAAANDLTAQMEFIDVHHGYLWGGGPLWSPSQTLWVTDDGGTTWDKSPIVGVADVSAIGGNVWAVSQACESAKSCQAVLNESTDYGAQWSVLPVGSIASGSTVELARITRSRSYILIEGPAAGPFEASIEYTADAGANWSSRPVPCGEAYQFGVELAASGTDDLWLVCGGQAGAGSQAKQIFRSSDAGAAWRLTAQTTVPQPPPAGVGSLSTAGYVAPYAIGHKTLDVLSPAVAWLQPGRNSVTITHDGGTSWSPVPGLQTAGFGNGAEGNLTFISGTQGWVCELGVGLWHTDDGVHWKPLGV